MFIENSSLVKVIHLMNELHAIRRLFQFKPIQFSTTLNFSLLISMELRHSLPEIALFLL